MSDRSQSKRKFWIIVIVLVVVVVGGSFLLTPLLEQLPAFEKHTKIQVCDLSDPKKIVVIDEEDFNEEVYSKDLDDCR